jgi:hypothetical protein
MGVVYRFAAIGSGVTRTIREIGTSSGSATSLVSRAIILDTSGNPMTITMYEGEVLDATYEYSYYYPLMTTTYSHDITINSTTYTVTWKAAETSSALYSIFGGADISGSPSLYTTSLFAYFYSGSVGAVSGSPSGTSSGFVQSTAASTYVAGSYERTYTWNLGLNTANYAGGITAMMVNNQGYSLASTPRFQCGISPGIPKTENDTMKISATVSVARY